VLVVYNGLLSVFVPVVLDTTILSDQLEGLYGARLVAAAAEVDSTIPKTQNIVASSTIKLFLILFSFSETSAH
jgi:hypothetical protein